MLKRTSSLEHKAFSYESSWDLQRNDEKLTMDLQARVKPKVSSQHLVLMQLINFFTRNSQTVIGVGSLSF